ncbi:MAG: NADH-quinone oxidoreductase subunit NuoG [Magnetococcus sp. WYHC-3]
MPTLIIDGKEIDVKPGATIMEAARKLGVPIPHFCYHPKLSIAGNCRMCLVEVEKTPRPVVSCAMPVSEGMVVKTQSDMVREARRGIMEFLLINHPLDCPVCDQGGECDLQDFAMKYGPDRARFHETKRDVVDRDIGPLIETVMNRCILCTRCVRFSEEISGLEEMGAVDRGDRMHVGPVVEHTLKSELSGNMAEICPVGALNLKPFHYMARGWELKRSPGICNHCAVGCRVRRDHQAGVVKRVMAAPFDAVNETWICDKGRFAYDGLGEARLTAPAVRDADGRHQSTATWPEALDHAAKMLKEVKPEEVAGLVGDDMAVAEDLFVFQDFMRRTVGTPHLDHRLRQRDFSGDDAPLGRADLLMNTPLRDLERADVMVLIGADTRYEAPLLNLRLRKAVQAGGRVYTVNPRRIDSILGTVEENVVPPGAEVAFLAAVLAALEGGSGQAAPGALALAAALKAAARPALLLGEYAVNHPQAETLRRLTVAISGACGALRDDWVGYNRLGGRAAAAAAQDLGVVPHRLAGYKAAGERGKNTRQILEAAVSGDIKVLFLLGTHLLVEAADAELARAALARARVIYLGAFDHATARCAEVVLAGGLVSEKAATLTNAEGRVQHAPAAVALPGQAKEDWRILRALSDRFHTSLPYNTLEAVRAAMAQAHGRYDLSEYEADEPTPACAHGKVTVGLDLNVTAAATARKGLVLVEESAFYGDDQVVKRSAVMSRLDQGERVLVSPEDAGRLGIVTGRRVRMIQGGCTIELEAQVDTLIPAGVVVGRYGYESALMQSLHRWDDPYPLVSLVTL